VPTPSTPSTSISGTNVIVIFDATANGSYVTSYKIYLQTSSSTWELETNCDGSNSSVISAKSCTIPFSVLLAPPFNLAGEASVYAKITATNAIGQSAESSAGNGATLPTASVPSAPQSLTMDSQSTSSVGFTWSAPSSNGGSAVLDYRVSWD
jgi:hypothetical protein